jgi:DNA-binding NarL/FixJ family response regulator
MRCQRELLLSQVLIADDSVPLRSGLRKLIEEHAGWVCAEALNGRDAITKVQQLPPDIVILGLHARNGRTSNGSRNQ